MVDIERPHPLSTGMLNTPQQSWLGAQISETGNAHLASQNHRAFLEAT